MSGDGDPMGSGKTVAPDPTAPRHDGYAEFRGHRTWYRVVGDLHSGKPPLVTLHGGPGGTHDYLEPYERLAESDRAIVFYDQLGAGRSTHLRDQEPGFWTVELFLE